VASEMAKQGRKYTKVAAQKLMKHCKFLCFFTINGTKEVHRQQLLLYRAKFEAIGEILGFSAPSKSAYLG
jgi:hypothetical protein